jgi:hypothetical protein
MAHNRVPDRKTGISNASMALILVIMMLLPSLPMATAVDPDPAVTKTGKDFEAVWDFSDPANYTMANTSITGGQLKLGLVTTVSMDFNASDFRAGSAYQILIRPKGTLALPYSHGSGFVDVGASMGVGATGHGQNVAWGDYNNDGLMDLLVGPKAGRNLLFKNNGDGSFTDSTVAAGIAGPVSWTAEASVWGDYNNDGFLDLAQSTAYGIILWKNKGDGTFTNATTTAGLSDYQQAKGLAWLDFNNDRKLDLFETVDTNQDRLWKNQGDGTFLDVASLAGLTDGGAADGHVIGTDYNNDGWTDIVRDFQAGNVRAYKNDKDGTFTEESAALGISAIRPDEPGPVAFDMRNDGGISFYWAMQGQDQLWAKGATTYTNVSVQAGIVESHWGSSPAIADYDLNGYQDIFVAGRNSNNELWHDDGQGHYTDVANAWGIAGAAYPALGTAWADYDNDGDPDLYIAQDGGITPSHLYKNNVDSENFIKVRLVDSNSDISSIGTRLELYTERSPGVYTLTGTREVRAGSGLGCSESPEQVFAANASLMQKLVVKFPDGTVKIIPDLEAPAYLKVDEILGVEYLKLTHHYQSPNSGTYTSRSFNVGNIANWGPIQWNATVPTGTKILVKTRTSPDNSTWSAWSSTYLSGEQIKSTKGAYLQYSIELSTTNTDVTPEVNDIFISYTKYAVHGTATTKLYTFSTSGLNAKFTSFGASNGQSIAYSYSKDGGKTWKDMPPDGNLSSESFSTITLRTELTTMDETTTPSVQYLKIHYLMNQAPSVALKLPPNNGYGGETQELKWNGTDPEGQKLTYDVYFGNTQPLPKVANNISEDHYALNNLVSGRTYSWYVTVKDPNGATNRSQTWSFIANSVPEVTLLAPFDGSKLTTNKVRFQWTGSDAEGQKLTYDLFLQKDGVLSKGLEGTNRSEVQLSLENKKSYNWYVIVNDSMLTNQSQVWSFSIDAPVNHLPRINNTPPSTGVVGKPYNCVLQIYDADGDHVIPTFIQGIPVPSGMTMTTTGGIIWTPQQPGIYLVALQLDDSKDQIRYYFNITVTSAPPNRPPKILPIPDQVVNKDPVTIDLLGYVSDDGGMAQVTFSLRDGNTKLFDTKFNGSKLVLTPAKNAKGKVNLTLVATDSLNAEAKYTFNVTVNNKDEKKQDIFTMLCLFWPVLLIVLILVIAAIAATVIMRRKERAMLKKPVQTQEKFETWDQMQGELYEEKKREAEEGPKFRGAARPGDDEVMDMDYQAQTTPIYVPQRQAPPPTYDAPPGPPQPMFAQVMPGRPEPVPEPEGPKYWSPVAAKEEEPKVFKDEKVDKAQQDAEIDDILSKLKSPDAEEPKKKPAKDPTLDELMSKLKR